SHVATPSSSFLADRRKMHGGGRCHARGRGRTAGGARDGMGRKSASMVMTPVGDRLRLFLLAAFVAVLVLRPTAAAAGYAPPAMRDAVTDTSGKLTEAEDRALE